MRLTYVKVSVKNVEQLRVLNAAGMPMRYSEAYYDALLGTGDHIETFLAYSGSICIAGCSVKIITRRASSPQPDAIPAGRNLYIMTLTTLAHYRRHGIATALLHHVLKEVADPTQCDRVALHVQENNENALAFYRKMGFEIEATLDSYYAKLTPSAAHLLLKPLHQLHLE